MARTDTSPGIKYLTDPQLCERYNVTAMSIWRWLNDPDMGFPQPALVIKDRRYWDEAQLVAWERGTVRPERRRRSPPRRNRASA